METEIKKHVQGKRNFLTENYPQRYIHCKFIKKCNKNVSDKLKKRDFFFPFASTLLSRNQ